MEQQLTTSTIAMIIGWVLTAVGLGRYVGKLKGKVEENEEDIREIKRMFLTMDGDQRFITHKAHDKIQLDCQRIQNERYDHLIRRLEEKDKILYNHLERLDSTVMELSKAIAKLVGAQENKK